MKSSTIWTIGHSTRSAEEFLNLLEGSEIQCVVDVRLYAGSRRLPHFNADHLRALLSKHLIDYHHFPELGGRRQPRPDSTNTAWKNESFRGYADYMETIAFQRAFVQLEETATRMPTAFMCAERLWWECHRGLIADLLKNKGWTVIHINSATQTQEHPYTSAARLRDGQLSYTEDELPLTQDQHANHSQP